MAAFGGAIGSAIGACSKLDLDPLRFSCTVSSDCGRDRVCDQLLGECVLPEDVIDAGVRGMDATAGDAEVDAGVAPDSGVQPGIGVCSPSIEATTIDTDHWWCRRMSENELRAFVDRFGAKILDLAPEPASQLFTAALERKTTGRGFDWTASIRFGDVQAAFFDRHLEVGDIHPFSGSGRDLLLAGTFEQYPGARFYGLDAPESGVYSTITAVLDDRGWRASSGYFPRIPYLTRWVRDQSAVYTWVGRVRNISMSSTITFDLGEAELDEYPGRILDVEPAQAFELFNVVTATRTPTDLETHFVANRSEAELDAALAEHSAHVWRIAVRQLGAQLVWSALMVKTPTTTVAELASRMSDESIGRPAIMLADVAGSTLAAANIDVPFRMSKLGIALVALYAFEQVQAGAASLAETEVPVYSISMSSQCPSAPMIGTSTLGHALEEMMLRAGYGHARGIVEHFGATPITTHAHAIGMTNTALNGTIGCSTDASTTTLADLVRLFRAIDRRLDDAHRAALLAIIPGVLPDPDVSWNAMNILPELVNEEAKRANVSAARRDQFLAHLELHLVHSVRPTDSARFRDPGVIGSATIPRCSGGSLEEEHWIFALGLLGAALDRNVYRDSDRSLYLSRVELLRRPIRNALSSFDCLP